MILVLQSNRTLRTNTCSKISRKEAQYASTVLSERGAKLILGDRGKELKKSCKKVTNRRTKSWENNNE